MTESVLSIDIAKLKFNICLINLNDKLKHKVLPDTSTGLGTTTGLALQAKLQRVHACLEATGTYGNHLALCLHQAEHGECGQSGSHQSLCRESALTHQDRPRGCRTDRAFISHKSLSRGRLCQQKWVNCKHLSADWSL